jgi:hypothetical protein
MVVVKMRRLLLLLRSDRWPAAVLCSSVYRSELVLVRSRGQWDSCNHGRLWWLFVMLMLLVLLMIRGIVRHEKLKVLVVL